MKIVGYSVHVNKQYVAFIEDERQMDKFKITDGFHDRLVTPRNSEKFDGYKWVDKNDIDLQKIIDRLRGTRPWHPLLGLLRKEVKA